MPCSASSGSLRSRNEHDACGVGSLPYQGKNQRSSTGLLILKNLTHRGAVGADPLAGDGAGILIQIPDQFFREEMATVGVSLPALGEYGVGMVFLPKEPAARLACEYEIERAIKKEGQVLLGWRDVPCDNSGLGESVKNIEPIIRQVFIGRGAGDRDGCAGAQALYHPSPPVRHSGAQTGARQGVLRAFDVGALSCQGHAVGGASRELLSGFAGRPHGLCTGAGASGFSTKPSRPGTWHPFRLIAHNGEINTLRGNVNWIRARQGAISSPILGRIWTSLAA